MFGKKQPFDLIQISVISSGLLWCLNPQRLKASILIRRPSNNQQLSIFKSTKMRRTLVFIWTLIILTIFTTLPPPAKSALYVMRTNTGPVVDRTRQVPLEFQRIFSQWIKNSKRIEERGEPVLGCLDELNCFVFSTFLK